MKIVGNVVCDFRVQLLFHTFYACWPSFAGPISWFILENTGRYGLFELGTPIFLKDTARKSWAVMFWNIGPLHEAHFVGR